MDFQNLINRANEIRDKYTDFEIKKTGKSWSREQMMEGMVGDIGDLMKLVMAKEGYRTIEDVDNKLKAELCDVFYCVLVLAKKYDINLEDEFLKSMDVLENRISNLEDH